MLKEYEYMKRKAFILLFAISCSILSSLLIVNTYYTNFNIIITLLVSFAGAHYVIKLTYDGIIKKIEAKPVHILFYLLLSASILGQLWIRKNSRVEYTKMLYFPVNKLWFHFLALLGMTYLLFIALDICRQYIFWIKSMTDEIDKKIWMFSTVIISVLIFLFYTSSSGWYASAYLPPSSEYMEVADVYGMDCGGVYKLLYADASYYDIRHPLFTVLIFPLWASVNTISKIFVPSGLRNLFNAVLLQMINAQFLILTGLHIKIATKKRINLIFYLISFPTLLYSISFEKYQVCTFLVSLFCVVSYSESAYAKTLYVIACSFMPTSAIVGVGEIMKKKKYFQMIKWWLDTIMLGIMVLVFFGRGHLLINGFTEIADTMRYFTISRISYIDRLIATLKMIQSCFFPLSSKIAGRLYTYNELYNMDCYLGVIIVIISLVGIIAGKKIYWIQIDSLWIVFSFILFIIFNWVPQEAPLFNIYFSWAVIPIFIEGLGTIVKKYQFNRNLVYFGIAGIMSIVNIMELVQIHRFYILMHY